MEMKVIRKYQNRKLYDTEESVYVTLDTLDHILKSGRDLRVIDNKTKNDITAATLTQLMHEKELHAKTQPSVELLKEIIRYGDGTFSGFIRSMIEKEVAAFDRNQTGRPSLEQ